MDTGEFTKRFLIGIGLLLATVFIISAHRLLLVVFAGVLFAVFLNGLATILQTRTTFTYGLSLTLVLAVIVILVGGMIWFLGPRLADQVSQMTKRIPEAVSQLQTTLEQNQVGRMLLARQQELVTGEANVLGRITGVFSTTLEALMFLVVVLVTGFFIATSPQFYISGLFHLIPPRKRDRIWGVFTAMGQALRWWLVGQFATMAIVFAMTTAGLLFAGVPLALTLGLIAGILNFVPYLGPVLSAIPAVMVAMLESFQLAVYTVLIFTGVQLIESNVVTPVIQRHAVLMPPAVLIVGQVIMGYLSGLIGIFLATPLLIIVIVAVQILYVKDEIGDSVNILGE